MTHTTTDAAEARAYEFVWDWLKAHPQPHDMQALMPAKGVIRAMLAFATAEAASGAGEREDGRAYNGGRCPDCDGTGDIIRLDGEWMGTCHCAASLPPATAPAMALDPVTIERCAKVADRMATSTAVPEEANNAAWNLAIAIRALAAAPTIPATGERWKHVKRGTVYEVIGRAELQTATDTLVDGSEMVIYRGEDGKLWVREEGEFHDGRFTTLAAIPATGHAATEGEGA